jgi:outer membrane translocation and assembly module TamA
MGAGTGQGRPVLLRAHPLLDEDVVAGPMFGRRVVFQTIEYQHPLKQTLAGAIGMAVFVDAARASGGVVAAAPPASNIDTGVGLRVRLIQGGVARLDFARGLQDGRLAFSVGWSSAAGSPFNRNASR